MLDQNTDRSWYMIGAVIVGALLIGAAQVFFPEMLTTIMGKFTEFLQGVKIGPAAGVINPFSLIFP